MTLTTELEELRIQKGMVEKKLKALSEVVFDKENGRPVLEKQLDYFEKLVTEDYPNPVFLHYIKAIRQFILYWELKDEIQKLTLEELDKYKLLVPFKSEKKQEEKKDFTPTF
jgi:hypothetical protein